MKGQISRAEVKNIHGRQMGSSKTQHVNNYKSNAKSSGSHSMNLRSYQAARDSDQRILNQMAQKKAIE